MTVFISLTKCQGPQYILYRLLRIILAKSPCISVQFFYSLPNGQRIPLFRTMNQYFSTGISTKRIKIVYQICRFVNSPFSRIISCFGNGFHFFCLPASNQETHTYNTEPQQILHNSYILLIALRNRLYTRSAVFFVKLQRISIGSKPVHIFRKNKTRSRSTGTKGTCTQPGLMQTNAANTVSIYSLRLFMRFPLYHVLILQAPSFRYKYKCLSPASAPADHLNHKQNGKAEPKLH